MYSYSSINKNGVSIRCKLYCNDIDKIDSIVVFGHGFAGHKDNMAAEKLANSLQQYFDNTSLIIFNWPCHGDDSLNRLMLSDCMEYLYHVIEYVKSKLQPKKLYACATSFGGYLFLKYIAENGNPFSRIVLRCPAVDMYDVLTKKIMTADDLDTARKGKPVFVGFDRKISVTKDFLSELKDNDISTYDFRMYKDSVVIIHGTKDEIVSYDLVRDFAEKNNIIFYGIESADHRFTEPKKMNEVVNRMIKEFQ